MEYRLVNMRCRICKRLIRSPSSTLVGMGKICYRKWKTGYAGLQLTIEVTNEQVKDLEQEI